MKILLDVGANTGQTVRAVLSSKYAFDKIVCFEPAPQCWAAIREIDDSRIELCTYGLGSETCEIPLYKPGQMDGTIFAEMAEAEDADAVVVQLVRATEWFQQHITADDMVFMKLNCEGSECDIVEDLLESHELQNVYNVMIDFDIRKIASMRGRELALRRKLRTSGYSNICFAEDVMLGKTHDVRIHAWLDLVGAHEALPLTELRDKYSTTMARLSSRTGWFARMEEGVRQRILRRMPSPLQSLLRSTAHGVRVTRNVVLRRLLHRDVG